MEGNFQAIWTIKYGRARTWSTFSLNYHYNGWNMSIFGIYLASLSIHRRRISPQFFYYCKFGMIIMMNFEIRNFSPNFSLLFSRRGENSLKEDKMSLHKSLWGVMWEDLRACNHKFVDEFYSWTIKEEEDYSLTVAVVFGFLITCFLRL